MRIQSEKLTSWLLRRESVAVDQKTSNTATARITISDVCREPFRLFFPIGLLAGILGVALWPLYFMGAMATYPNLTHPRIMTFGFFGAFIFGFLGTALPRMLSAQPFRHGEVALLFALHTGMMVCYLGAHPLWGDLLFLVLWTAFLVIIGFRFATRQDTPPPGFVLVGMAFIAVLAGTVLGIVKTGEEDASWMMLQRLLCYQGFVLLPILGVGPFILPRFFDLPNKHDFPETKAPDAAWRRKALTAGLAGAVLISSFVLEAFGWTRTGHAIRFFTVIGYLLLELPLYRSPKFRSVPALGIHLAILGILAGYLTAWFFPAFRISWLHLTFIGGFAGLVFVVATRVVYGHSGNGEMLKLGKNRWLAIAIGTMLFGMTTRMSGDFWPKVMISHYNYGAILWIAGALVWAAYVLPKVLVPDPDK